MGDFSTTAPTSSTTRLQAFVLAFLAQAITWLMNPAGGRGRAGSTAGTWLAMIVGLVLVASRPGHARDHHGPLGQRGRHHPLRNHSFHPCCDGRRRARRRNSSRRRKTRAADHRGPRCIRDVPFDEIRERAKAPIRSNRSKRSSIPTTGSRSTSPASTSGMPQACSPAGFAGVYMIARLFDPARKDAEFYRTLTGCTYGIVCFGLLFSLVGTILGGLWANDSLGPLLGLGPEGKRRAHDRPLFPHHPARAPRRLHQGIRTAHARPSSAASSSPSPGGASTCSASASTATASPAASRKSSSPSTAWSPSSPSA